MKRMGLLVGCVVLACWGGGVRGAPALPRGGMVLDDTPLVDFKVDPARAVGVGSNLVVRTTMKFGYAYANEYPEIPAGKTVGVAACRFGQAKASYHVLAKDPVAATNRWTDTGIAADTQHDVPVEVTVSRGKAGRPAIRYRFGESGAFGPVEVVAEGRLRSVGFAGAGEVGELSVSE